MTQANEKNTRVGTMLVLRRNPTSTWYVGREVVVTKIAKGDVHFETYEGGVLIQDEFGLKFLSDFDVVPPARTSQSIQQTLHDIELELRKEASECELKLAGLQDKIQSISACIAIINERGV